MIQSYEVLETMNSQTMKFEREKVYRISPWGSLFLFVFFLISLCITGLLVYYLVPCSEKKHITENDLFLKNLSKKKNFYDKLSKIVVPDMYDIQLIPFIWENNFTFHGEVMLYNSVIFFKIVINILFMNVSANANILTLFFKRNNYK